MRAAVTRSRPQGNESPVRRRILVVGDRRKPGVADAAEELLPRLEPYARSLDRDLDGTSNLAVTEAELVLCVGGDGTILDTARRLGTNPIPILGVKTGKLGFLAELTLERLRDDPALVAGPIRTVRRIRLEVACRRDGESQGGWLAVNEGIVSARSIARISTIGIRIDGGTAARFRGDGLIAATPVGSTAHSLSAGGPIVEQSLDAILVTPINPHTLTFRPLVIASGHEVEFEIGPGEGIALTVDGRTVADLDPGDRVGVRRSEHDLILAEAAPRDYFSLLREKLRWGVPPSGV